MVSGLWLSPSVGRGMGTTERGKDRLALREVGRSRRRAATVTFFILYPI